MHRYMRLLVAQGRLALLVSAQYRVDFIVDGAIEVLWTSTALAPLLVVFGLRTHVAGRSFGEALVVVLRLVLSPKERRQARQDQGLGLAA